MIVFEISSVWKAGRRGLDEVVLRPEPLDRFASVLDIDEYDALQRTATAAQRRLGGRTVWNVTSTARGGGVAEMLTSLLPLACDAGVEAHWLVIRAEDEFFRITKRIHNLLHGDPGDGGDLGARERDLYEGVLREIGSALERTVAPRDIVILHDPQTAGLTGVMGRAAAVIWRCHIGVDEPNALVHRAWRFLVPYLESADAYVFTRRVYAFEGLAASKVVVIPPSIDIFSPKNEQLTKEQVAGILEVAKLVEGAPGDTRYKRLDGSIGTVSRTAELFESAPVPQGVPIVTQISRWDRLKDPVGLVQGFAEHVIPLSEAHLVVAGPAVNAVSDDPEGWETLNEVRRAWSSLAPAVRARIHLTCLPMDDAEENAAIVNALQRRASIVVQKSLAEGFGLTVAEGMWKERPIVASRVGGIQDQIVDRESGILVDPRDLRAFGEAVLSVLTKPSYAQALGRAAHLRCRQEYLAPKHLMRYASLFESVL
jgi:trehalose synthase